MPITGIIASQLKSKKPIANLTQYIISEIISTKAPAKLNLSQYIISEIINAPAEPPPEDTGEVELLLPLDIDFSDKSVNNITPIEGDVTATWITDTGMKFGAGCLETNADGGPTSDCEIQYNLPALVPLDPCTFEGWLFTNGCDNQGVVEIGKEAVVCYLYLDSPNKINLYDHNRHAIQDVIIPLGQWFHFAWVINSGMHNLYINGVLSGSGTISVNGYPNISWLTLSKEFSDPPASNNLLLDEIRFTSGAALYTENFTPPTGPFPRPPVEPPSSIDEYWDNVVFLLRGEDFTDTSKYNRTVTAYDNTQISNTEVKFGTGSIELDGNADYITIENSDVDFGLQDLTMEMWINPRTADTHYLYNIYNGSFTSRVGIDLLASDASNVRANLYVSGGYQISGLSDITIGEWTHLVAERVSGVWTLYINGVADPDGTTTSDTNMPATEIMFGTRIGGTASVRYDGFIDEARLTVGVARYNGNFIPPISQFPTDVPPTDDYKNIILSDNPVSYFRMDDADGSSVMSDVTGIANVVIGGIPVNFEQPGAILNNSNYSMELTSGAYGLESTLPTEMETSQGAIECWVKLNSASSVQYVCAFGGSASQHHYLGMRVGTDSKIGIYSYNDSSYRHLNSTTALNLDEWYHVVIQSTGTEFEIYINGAKETLSTLLGSNDGRWVSDDAGINNWAIGGRHRLGSLDVPIDAFVDEVAVYDKVLTALQVLNHYNKGINAQPVVEGDEYWDEVEFLLPFEDDKIDVKNGRVFSSAATLGDTLTPPYGTNYLDVTGQTGGYVIADDFTIPADFTAEMWWSPISLPDWGALLAKGSWNGTGCFVLITNSNTVKASIDGAEYCEFSFAAVVDTWYHIAFTRESGTCRIFIDGVEQISETAAADISSTATFDILYHPSGAAGVEAGYARAKDVRFTNGVCRYNTDFAPPTDFYPTNTTPLMDEIMSDSPRDYWRFDETGGSEITSLGDAAHTGNLIGSATLGSDKISLDYGSKSGRFDGGQFNIGAAQTDSLDTFGVELLAAADDWSDEGTFWKEGGYSNGYQFGYRSGNIEIGFRGTTYVSLTHPIPVEWTNGSTHHIAFSLISNNTLTLYFDGEVVATDNNLSIPSHNGSCEAGIGNCWCPDVVGYQAPFNGGAGVDNAFEFIGYISDLATYLTPLTDVRIAYHAKAAGFSPVIPVPPAVPLYDEIIADGAAHYWPLRGTALNVVGSPNGNKYSEVTFDDTALSLDDNASSALFAGTGHNGRVELGSLNTDSNVTVTLLANANDWTVDGSFFKEGGTGNGYQFAIYQGQLQGGVRSATSTLVSVTWNIPVEWTAGSTHHLAFSIDGDGSELRLYADGYLVATTSSAIPTHNGGCTAAAGNSSCNASDWQSPLTGGTTQMNFQGYMSDIAVWTGGVLSDSQILRHAFLAGVSDSYMSLVLLDGPVFYWPMNGDSEDITSNAHHATIDAGAPTFDGPSAIIGEPGNSSAVFADGDRLIVADDSRLNPTDNFAYEIWFKTTMTADGGRLFWRWTPSNQLFISLNDGGNGEIRVYSNIGQRDLSLSANDGEWHHFVFQKNGNDGEVWFDGVKEHTAADAGTLSPFDQPLYIGGDPSGYEIVGNLAHAAYYDKGLTPEEIGNHYNKGIETPTYEDLILFDGPVSYFKLDETGSPAVDETGNSSGTYEGCTLEQDGLITEGSSVLFGSSNRISVTDMGMAGTSYSYECWIKPTALGGYQPLFYQSGLALYCTNNNLDFYFSGSHTNSTALVNDTIYHVVLSVDNGTGTFYLNGVADGTVNGCPAGNPLYFGSHSTLGAEQFIGYMDEAAFYQYALTAQQALDHYNAGV